MARLIKSGADVNAKNENGRTALMYAAWNNVTDVAKVLIDAGADVNAKGNAGETALMHAAARNAVDVAKALIAAKADVNARAEGGGVTALMVAKTFRAWNIVTLLKQYGAWR